MNSVQELGVLHRRYAEISHRFRAAWTFHQFIQSLQKSTLPGSAGGLATEFQDLYAELKEISQNLSAADGELVRARLDAIDRRLGDLVLALEREDTKVPPDFLRQFFLRVKSYDEKILTQLVKFYLYAHDGGPWPTDRLDKIDFLVTRLSEEEHDRTGALVLRDHKRLTEIFAGLWALSGAEQPTDVEVMARLREIEVLRAEVDIVDDLGELHDSQLVRRYRDLKHGLGALFFEPELLLAIQEANLAFKNRIQKLYRQDARRIADEYQRVFELEREVPVDMQLDAELTQFREDIERFESQLQRNELKLEHLAQIRQRVRSLLPRLSAAARSTEETAPEPDLDVDFEPAGRPVPQAERPSAHSEVLDEPYRRMMAALTEQSRELSPEALVLVPDLFPLRLEPREVLAFRRLERTDGGGAKVDRNLERFLLEAAAIRVRANEEAQEIAGLLDETSVTGDSPMFVQARHTARAGDEYAWRFNHAVHQALLAGDLEEGRTLEMLRMRLLRVVSGLWLLAYKPLFGRRSVLVESAEVWAAARARA